MKKTRKTRALRAKMSTRAKIPHLALYLPGSCSIVLDWLMRLSRKNGITPPLTIDQIMDRSGCGRMAVQSALNRLAKDRFIIKLKSPNRGTCYNTNPSQGVIKAKSGNPEKVSSGNPLSCTANSYQSGKADDQNIDFSSGNPEKRTTYSTVHQEDQTDARSGKTSPSQEDIEWLEKQNQDRVQEEPPNYNANAL